MNPPQWPRQQEYTTCYGRDRHFSVQGFQSAINPACAHYPSANTENIKQKYNTTRDSVTRRYESGGLLRLVIGFFVLVDWLID
jgi:hypothetical protein